MVFGTFEIDMRAIDTNVLVRLLARDDETQTAQAEEFVQQGAWLSLLVLAEAIWVLQAVYNRRPAELAKVIEMLLDHQSLTLQDFDIVSEALKIYRSRPSLGFSDCLILEVARKAGHVPLGTSDRQFAKLQGVQKL